MCHKLKGRIDMVIAVVLTAAVSLLYCVGVVAVRARKVMAAAKEDEPARH